MTIQPRSFTPKRGIKSLTMTLTDSKVEYKPHHQKALILTILKEDPTKSMSLKEMVEKIEKDESLWSLLQSKQSVLNCVTYHMKDLTKLGVLKVVEAEAKPEAK